MQSAFCNSTQSKIWDEFTHTANETVAYISARKSKIVHTEVSEIYNQELKMKNKV